jgi:hypothetical protein
MKLIFKCRICGKKNTPTYSPYICKKCSNAYRRKKYAERKRKDEILLGVRETL